MFQKHAYIFFLVYHSPALKKWGYIGFAMSFHHSKILWLHILLNTFNVSGPTSIKLIPHLVPEGKVGVELCPLLGFHIYVFVIYEKFL